MEVSLAKMLASPHAYRLRDLKPEEGETEAELRPTSAAVAHQSDGPATRHNSGVPSTFLCATVQTWKWFSPSVSSWRTQLHPRMRDTNLAKAIKDPVKYSPVDVELRRGISQSCEKQGCDFLARKKYRGSFGCRAGGSSGKDNCYNLKCGRFPTSPVFI